jgi:hypothetical protein
LNEKLSKQILKNKTIKSTKMKKTLLTLTSMGIVASALAQLPVSTTQQNKKVVLEEFTGIHCVWCPDGHKRANELKAAKPAGSVVLVNIHTGGFASPAAGEPDFRTADGNAIAAISGMNITGYPTGSVNRHLFTGQSGYAVSRADWSNFADQILNAPSYVNVALQGTLDVSTRLLTVNVEAYYTANGANTNNLTVVLMEDNVYGPQTGGLDLYPAMVNADGTYTHNHMLRKVLTPSATGEVINTTTQGTTVSKTYTYTVPEQFVNNAPMLGNLQIAAFVAEGNSEILTAAYGPITLTGFANTKAGELKSTVTAETAVCEGKLTPQIKLYNNGSETITSATITYKVNGGTENTYNFTGAITPATQANIQLPGITFTPAASNEVLVTVPSINGSANQSTATSGNVTVAQTTKSADNKVLVMNFTQDQYGSESSWKLIEEATGTVVGQDGPFANLSASGILLHTKNIEVDPSKCYVLQVMDSYGDGINAGAGAGKYELKSGSNVIVSSNGQYGKGENTWFKTAAQLVSINDLIVDNSLSLYPNPTANNAVLTFTLKNASETNISVYDLSGRLIQTLVDGNLEAGVQKLNISTANLATGIYQVKISSNDANTTLRLSVVK